MNDGDKEALDREANHLLVYTHISKPSVCSECSCSPGEGSVQITCEKRESGKTTEQVSLSLHLESREEICPVCGKAVQVQTARSTARETTWCSREMENNWALEAKAVGQAGTRPHRPQWEWGFIYRVVEAHCKGSKDFYFLKVILVV